jgi:hypothetical protein
VIAAGNDADRVWVGSSTDGTAWPEDLRSPPLGDEATNLTPGVERATGLPTLVWAGRSRFAPANGGGWEPAPDGRLPMPLAPGRVSGGPRGYLAAGAIDPASGAHRAWTWDGEGSWTPVDGSDDKLSRADGASIVDIVADDDGWLIVMRQGARYTGWQVER